MLQRQVCAVENHQAFTCLSSNTLNADSEIQFEVFLKQLLKNGNIYEKLTEENHKETCDCSCRRFLNYPHNMDVLMLE